MEWGEPVSEDAISWESLFFVGVGGKALGLDLCGGLGLAGGRWGPGCPGLPPGEVGPRVVFREGVVFLFGSGV